MTAGDDCRNEELLLHLRRHHRPRLPLHRSVHTVRGCANSQRSRPRDDAEALLRRGEDLGQKLRVPHTLEAGHDVELAVPAPARVRIDLEQLDLAAITAVACACTAPCTPFGTLPRLDVCSLGTMPRRSSAAARIWARSSGYRIPWRPAMMLSLPSQHQPGFGLTSSSLISPLASARKSNRA